MTVPPSGAKSWSDATPRIATGETELRDRDLVGSSRSQPAHRQLRIVDFPGPFWPDWW
jgi:hypothetical protein